MADTLARGRCILFAGLLLAATSAGSAQTPTDFWDVSADVGFNLARGNSHLTLFSLALQLTRLETESFELGWSANVLYGENADSVVARRYRTGLGFDWHPEAKVSPFVFAEAERDRFRKLAGRTNLGVGAKYVLWRAERTSGSVSAAILHDYQRFTGVLPDSIRRSRSFARWSFRARGKGELYSGVALEHVTFVKPALDDIDDYDIDATTKASLRVSDRFAVTLSWALRYDSTPPEDVRRDDQLVQVGLRVEL